MVNNYPINSSGPVLNEGDGLGSIIRTIFFVILLAIFGVIVFLNAPGMVLMGTIGIVFWPTMKTGQAWVLSLIISSIFASWAMLSKGRRGLMVYVVCCAVLLACGSVLHWVFESDLPTRTVKFYIPKFEEKQKPTQAQTEEKRK
jgi:hypothetical protein